jgi:hypothetical protein
VHEVSLKYVARQEGDKKVEYLFDLERDSGEKHNLFADRGADAARLKKRLAEWEQQVQPKR